LLAEFDSVLDIDIGLIFADIGVQHPLNFLIKYVMLEEMVYHFVGLIKIHGSDSGLVSTLFDKILDLILLAVLLGTFS